MKNEITLTVIPSKVPNSVVTYVYSLDLWLLSVSFNNDAGFGFKKSALDEAPLRISYTKGSIPPEFEPFKAVGCQIRDITEFDFSYENLANIYGYKVGDIKKQRKLCEQLSFEDKILAFAFIPRYKAYLNRTNIAQLYLERYLSQRRWENTLQQY